MFLSPVVQLPTQYDCSSFKFSCGYTVVVFILFSFFTSSHINTVSEWHLKGTDMQNDGLAPTVTLWILRSLLFFIPVHRVPICLITCQYCWLACYISWFSSTHFFVSSRSFTSKWSTCLCFNHQTVLLPHCT